MPIKTASTSADEREQTPRSAARLHDGDAKAADSSVPDERVRSMGVWFIDHWLEWVCLAAVGVVMAIAPALDQGQRNAFYSTEQSIVERSSVALWMLLAIAVPISLRSMSIKTIAASIVCLAAAAREASLHSSITGYSVLKIPFYYRAEFPVAERAIAATIVIALVASLVIVTITIAHAAYASGWYRVRWVRRLVAFAMLAPFSKVLDRAPDLLSKQGIELGAMTVELMGAAEETLEFFLPVLLFAATIAYARRRRAVRASPPAAT